MSKLEAWAQRAELLTSGVEPLRRAALEALAEARPWQARYLAFKMLDAVPTSPLALLIWADAAEAMLLDEEAREALERLARVAPYRADVWLRLAEVQTRTGLDAGPALARAAAQSEPRSAVRQAALGLLERALDAGDVPRALALAGRVSSARTLTRVERARVAEAALDAGDLRTAAHELAATDAIELLDARGWFTLGRLRARQPGRDALPPLRRALILGSRGLVSQVAEFLAEPGHAELGRALGPLGHELGVADVDEWQVVRALADERSPEALAVLERQSRKAPSRANLCRWLALGLRLEAPEALELGLAVWHREAAGAAPARAVADAEAVLAALALEGSERLTRLDLVRGEGKPWAHALRSDVYADWLDRGDVCGLGAIVGEVEELARGWLDTAVLDRAASLKLDLERPLRVVVIGEFNAGKSSIINSILGESVAPVGVLPTTAVNHRLRWAPDRFVRVDFRDALRESRVLEYEGLGPFLRQTDAREIREVGIFGPLAALRSLEVIDTPGFNADASEHQARAIEATRNAHVLVWVQDATAVLKASDATLVRALRSVELPVCVVVNKSDRVDAADLERVLVHTADGLGELGIELELPLVAFSTHYGAGVGVHADRAGLPELLGALLERAPRLKARALVEHTRALLGELKTRYAPDVVAAGRRLEALARATRRLQLRQAGLESEWTEALGPSLKQLQNELRLLPQGQLEASVYAASRSAEVLGKHFFVLVSGALQNEGELQEWYPMLMGSMQALARGLGQTLLSSRNGELATLVGRLLYAETMQILERIRVSSTESSPGSADSPSAAPLDTRACWERLVALEVALERASAHLRANDLGAGGPSGTNGTLRKS